MLDSFVFLFGSLVSPNSNNSKLCPTLQKIPTDPITTDTSRKLKYKQVLEYTHVHVNTDMRIHT